MTNGHGEGSVVLMPRQARARSKSGYYHIMFRGNGRQIVFEDDADRMTFLELLEAKASDWNVRILAWCLMDNHVHLLLDDPREHLSGFAHALLTAYAGRYNARTAHVGAVFQPRFDSVAVESNRQLLCAAFYIHDNPVRAGVAPRSEYPWSSYHVYTLGEGFADTSTILELAGGRLGFVEMCSSGRYSDYVFRPGVRVPESEARAIAERAMDGRPLAELKMMPIAERDRVIMRMAEAGLSNRQIERQTGVGRGAVALAIARCAGAAGGSAEE